MARRTAPPKYIQKRTPKTFVFFHWNYHACSDIGVAFSHRFCIRGTQISSREPMVSRDARSPPPSVCSRPRGPLQPYSQDPALRPRPGQPAGPRSTPQPRPHPNDPSGVPRRCYDKNTFATGGSGGQVHHIFLLRNCTPKINEKPCRPNSRDYAHANTRSTPPGRPKPSEYSELWKCRPCLFHTLLFSSFHFCFCENFYISIRIKSDIFEKLALNFFYYLKTESPRAPQARAEIFSLKILSFCWFIWYRHVFFLIL